MSVLFDGRYIQDRYHGIGRYAFHLVDALAGLMPWADFSVLRTAGAIESRFDWRALRAHPNLDVREINAPLFSVHEQVALPAALASARRAYASTRGVLYHSPYFALPWLFARVPSIVTVHDCIFERDSRYMPKRWARLYYTALMRTSIARASFVAVPSRATAHDLRRFYRVPRRKIVVTPEAADSSFRPILSRACLDSVRERYDLPAEFVLAVGARRPHKNFARLVSAVGRIDGATLVFVGQADERFRDTAAEVAIPLGGRVRFLGKVDEGDLPALYNLASVVACPSIVEGFGLPVLEGMACGTPVVCSDIPVFREVAGSAALYAPVGSTEAWAKCLADALQNPSLQAHLSRRGLERAAEYSWRKTAESLVPAYSLTSR